MDTKIFFKNLTQSKLQIIFIMSPFPFAIFSNDVGCSFVGVAFIG